MSQVRVNFWSGSSENIPEERQSGRILFEEDTGNVYLDVMSRKDGALFRVQLSDTNLLDRRVGGALEGPLMLSRDPEEGMEAATKMYVDLSAEEVSDKLQEHVDDSDAHVSEEDRESWDGKVDKEAGKGLSANDFTDALNRKLDGISNKANRTEFESAVDGSDEEAAVRIGTVTIDGEPYGVYIPAVADVPGNAGSATRLESATTIDGISFDGTAPVEHYVAGEVSDTGHKISVDSPSFVFEDGALLLVDVPDPIPPAESSYSLEVLGEDGAFSRPLMSSGMPVNPTGSDAGEYPKGLYIIVADASRDVFVVASKPSNLDLVTQSARGLMSSSDKSKLDSVEEGANAYTLPEATEQDLGGVIVGDNITVVGGKISVTAHNIETALGYSPSETNGEPVAVPVFEGGDPGLVPANPDNEPATYLEYKIDENNIVRDSSGHMAGYVSSDDEILLFEFYTGSYYLDAPLGSVEVGTRILGVQGVYNVNPGDYVGHVTEVDLVGVPMTIDIDSDVFNVDPVTWELIPMFEGYTGPRMFLTSNSYIRKLDSFNLEIHFDDDPPTIYQSGDLQEGEIDVSDGDTRIRWWSYGGSYYVMDPDSRVGEFLPASNPPNVEAVTEYVHGRIYPYGSVTWLGEAPVGSVEGEIISFDPDAPGYGGISGALDDIIMSVPSTGPTDDEDDEGPAEPEEPEESEEPETISDVEEHDEEPGEPEGEFVPERIGTSKTVQIGDIRLLVSLDEFPDTQFAVTNDDEVYTLSQPVEILSNSGGITAPDGEGGGRFEPNLFDEYGSDPVLYWGDPLPSAPEVKFLSNSGDWVVPEAAPDGISSSEILEMITSAASAVEAEAGEKLQPE